MPEQAPRRVLFVCHYNRTRSATAERLFKRRADLDVLSAGTSEEALVRINSRLLEWADVIFVMDTEGRRSLDEMFPSHPALDRVICLDISDDYTFLDPALVKLLQDRVAQHLGSV